MNNQIDAATVVGRRTIICMLLCSSRRCLSSGISSDALFQVSAASRAWAEGETQGLI